MNYTYLLRCADNSLYCGWTNHLAERVEAHNAGKGAKYTKGRGPVTLAYFESFETKEEALRREAAIKKLTRAEKEALIKQIQNPVQAADRRPLRIIISPAKKMRMQTDDQPWKGLPCYLSRAEMLLTQLKGMTEAQLKELFQANDAITHENYRRFQDMELTKNLTPALLSYVGIQYQYMAPQIFSREQWNYVCEKLRILSGFYGILRPDDGIVPYRLELQAKLKTKHGSDLYKFWQDQIYQELAASHPAKPERQGTCILNLASKEYSKAVEPFLKQEDLFITCIFGTEINGKVKVKATEAKMARGEMVRFLAETGIEDITAAKKFNRLNYCFCPEKSGEKEYVFIKRKEYD